LTIRTGKWNKTGKWVAGKWVAGKWVAGKWVAGKWVAGKWVAGKWVACPHAAQPRVGMLPAIMPTQRCALCGHATLVGDGLERPPYEHVGWHWPSRQCPAAALARRQCHPTCQL